MYIACAPAKAKGVPDLRATTTIPINNAIIMKYKIFMERIKKKPARDGF
jgi:hypothetical protein